MKEQEIIKSVTHCPTCGSECTVGGNTTHYYIPKNSYSEEEVRKISINFFYRAYGTDELDIEKIFNEYFEQHKKKQL